jgi:holo-[acyl-carrier protein] synthase
MLFLSYINIISKNQNDMISFSIGIDMVLIDKFTDLTYSKNQKFYSKIFTDQEIKYCQKFKDPYPHFAGLFALKEATVKAVKKNIFVTDVEIVHGENNEPKILCSKNDLNFTSSLSHEDKFAIGVVVSFSSL